MDQNFRSNKPALAQPNRSLLGTPASQEPAFHNRLQNRSLFFVLAALGFLSVGGSAAFGQSRNASASQLIRLQQRALGYFLDLLKIDTSNPPGHETRVTQYLKGVCDREGIPNEVLGGSPDRMNFVARLKASGASPNSASQEQPRPLMLMAHSDVVPVQRDQWTVEPFTGLVKDGYIWGRGSQDTKCLLAAELAVLVELKRSGARLKRDVIFLSEADEEAGSTGVQWLIAHAWDKINAEFAINEGGFAQQLENGKILYNVQTTEKIPTRVHLAAHGSAGHGSLPRPDNPVVHLAQAIVKLAEAEQPVRLNATTREYFRSLATLPEYQSMTAAFSQLENVSRAPEARNTILRESPLLAAQLSTSVSPTMTSAGVKVNIIPSIAEGSVDVRRLPDETKQEILERFRKIIDDPLVEVEALSRDQDMPSAEPSSRTSALYTAIETTIHAADKNGVVLPNMSLGATDGSFLRTRGMGVYGIPIFPTPAQERRAHGDDERISSRSFNNGVLLLREVVRKVAE
jgi:acetylornithine deacetylase/succinyl-diaminopimelate desuccinylase-like protein